MAWILILLFVFNLPTLVLSGNNCPETTGFCSQVYEMQRVCSGLSPESQIVTSKVGKAGPPGRKGEPGEPAAVDYGEINKKITTKFRELESRIDAKFKKYDQLVEKLDKRTKEIELRFGKKKTEFWMGLEDIHQLVHAGDYELTIDLTDWAGKSAYAKYRSFLVGDASIKYRLSFGSYSGNAGNALDNHKNQRFTTKDQDNDAHPSGNCAAEHDGGWWFGACDHANLDENGVEWHQWNHGGSTQ